MITFTPVAGTPLVVSSMCVEIGGFSLILNQFNTYPDFDCTYKSNNTRLNDSDELW